MVDFVFFSVQKGFGMPAGLGIAIVSGRAVEKAKFLSRTDCFAGGYFNLANIHQRAQKCQTIETPNVLAIYLLGKICNDFLEKGIQNIRKETDKKADLIYRAIDGHRTLKPFIANGRLRSKTIITADGGGEAAGIIARLAARGFIVGKGYGEHKDRCIRIANFPAHTVEDTRELINLLNEPM
jgi:phosphoserine aminotransferase